MSTEDQVPDDEQKLEHAVQEADVFLRAIALVAKGEEPEGLRAEIVNALPEIESQGLTISVAVEQIWAGERDPETLTEELDDASTVVVRRILELIDMPSPNEILASLPPALREALEKDDSEAFMEAINGLSEEEQMAVTEQLIEAGLFGGPGGGEGGMDEVMDAFEPVLIAIAEVAKGGVSDDVRKEIENELAYMEENDVQITESVHRIWQGERDRHALTADLDSVDTSLVDRILELVSE